MLKVALVSTAYPPYTFGGIDIQTYHLAHALSSAGVNVTVYCGFSKKPTISVENDNLTICRLPLFNYPPRVVWFQLNNMNYFKNAFKNYDIIHTQHSSGSFYGLFQEKNRQPWVVSLHDHELRRLLLLFSNTLFNMSLGDIIFYSLGYPLFKYLSTMEIRYADHYIVCGLSGFLDYINFSKIKRDKTTLIPNGINIDKVKSAAKSYKEKLVKHSGNDDFTLFTCGRLYSNKGIQYLIKAMPRIIKNIPNIRLKIFGRGPLHNRFKKEIHDLNLVDHVSLEGFVPYEKLMYEMSVCDIAVFPSLLEVGASFAVMEAMTFCKPVVAFNYPFTTEIIEHLKTGYLVPPKNIYELEKAISILYNDSDLRKKIGRNAYNNVIKHHNWSNTVKKYVDVYSKIISNKN